MSETSGFRHRLSEKPSDVRTLGVSFGFPSVGLALAAGNLTGALLAWPLGFFFATVVYLFVLRSRWRSPRSCSPS